MKTAVLWTMIGLNAVLIGGLFARSMKGNEALAQVRRPPEYILIPAQLTGVTNDVIFVIDSANNVLGGFSYDTNANRLDLLPMQDLSRVFEAGQAAPRTNVVPGAGAGPGGRRP